MEGNSVSAPSNGGTTPEAKKAGVSQVPVSSGNIGITPGNSRIIEGTEGGSLSGEGSKEICGGNEGAQDKVGVGTTSADTNPRRETTELAPAAIQWSHGVIQQHGGFHPSSSVSITCTEGGYPGIMAAGVNIPSNLWNPGTIQQYQGGGGGPASPGPNAIPTALQDSPTQEAVRLNLVAAGQAANNNPSGQMQNSRPVGVAGARNGSVMETGQTTPFSFGADCARDTHSVNQISVNRRTERGGEDMSRRKRNRLGEQDSGKGFDSEGAGNALETLLESVAVMQRAQPRGSPLREAVETAARKLAIEINKLLTKLVQRQEENGYLLQQIVQLQEMRTGESKRSGATYADVARGEAGKEVIEGKRLPIAHIPPMVRLAPAERTMVIKSERKEGVATREKQQAFRNKLKETVGEDLAGEISAVRPTRYGGYTVIAASETARDRVAEAIVQQGVIPAERLVKPRKRTARMVCKNPPDITPAEFLQSMYSRHNPELFKVPLGSRLAKINKIRLGWIFELSAAEAIACEAQGGRVRHSFGMEAHLDEFIPLQQCYNCASFGHEAKDCKARRPRCRLCGKEGHGGRDCPNKDNREVWRCCNCRQHNENKGTKLPMEHAAAQLHLCAVAIKEKEIRREQLRASGVFVSTRPGGVRSSRSAQIYDTTAVNACTSDNEEPRRPRRLGSSMSVTSGVESRTAAADSNRNRISGATGGQRKMAAINSDMRPARTQMVGGTQSAREGGGARVTSGRVRWQDDGQGEETTSNGVWNIVSRGRKGRGRGATLNNTRTPVGRGNGGGRGRDQFRETPQSTPGTAVEINSEMDEEDFDI